MKKKLGALFDYLKKYRAMIIIFVVLTVVFLCSSPFIAVNFPNNNLAESCFSVVTDKWEMNTVDKIIIKTPRQKTTITDKDLIKQIVKETMVAETGGYKVSYGKYYLFLYHGDKLIRTVQLSNTYREYAIVYQADATHWVIGYESGTAILSNDLILRIEKALKDNGDAWLIG